MKNKIIFISAIVVGIAIIIGAILWFGRGAPTNPPTTTITANEQAIVNQINLIQQHLTLIENYLIFENPDKINAFNKSLQK
jgi:ABC-type uncharacterized transport system ATPase subunit